MRSMYSEPALTLVDTFSKATHLLSELFHKTIIIYTHIDRATSILTMFNTLYLYHPILYLHIIYIHIIMIWCMNKCSYWTAANSRRDVTLGRAWHLPWGLQIGKGETPGTLVLAVIGGWLRNVPFGKPGNGVYQWVQGLVYQSYQRKTPGNGKNH